MKADSCIHDFKSLGYDIHDFSLLTFKPVHFQDPNSDLLFFYSKNGIRFYFEGMPYKLERKYAVMGPASAEYFESVTGRKPHFVGDGSAEEIAEQLIAFAEGMSIHFIRAQQSKNSIELLVKHLLDTQGSTVVYDNSIDTKAQLPEAQILIFTSPLNVLAYFEQKRIEDQIVLAIGPTTKAELEKFGLSHIHVSSSPDEQSLCALLSELINTD